MHMRRRRHDGRRGRDGNRHQGTGGEGAVAGAIECARSVTGPPRRPAKRRAGETREDPLLAEGRAELPVEPDRRTNPSRNQELIQSSSSSRAVSPMRSRLAHPRHNARSKGSENGGDGAATWKARKAPVHGRRGFGSTASLASKDRALESGAFETRRAPTGSRRPCVPTTASL